MIKSARIATQDKMEGQFMLMHRIAVKLVVLVVLGSILPAALAAEAPAEKIKVH